MPLTHLDLCSGIGGFHIAAGWAGFDTLGFSEVEPYCCRLLAEKWPEIPNYGDIRTADFSWFRGRITVLSAGVPCQPASLAGKRRGAHDDRWLWPAVLDVVGTVEPAWAIFENPPGILTLDEFGGVLLHLGALGYQVRAFCVQANAVGAKHRRQRVFIVAHAGSSRREAGITERSRESKAKQWSESFTGESSLASEALANRERQRLEGAECYRSNVEQRAWSRSGCGEALADADDRAGLEEHESRQPGQRDAVIRSSGPLGFRLTQPPLLRRVDGVPNRSHRLKALGNAVVPQQAYPFFAAIAEIENQ